MAEINQDLYWNDSKRSLLSDSVDEESLAIQGEDVTDARFFGKDNETPVSKVHGYVRILHHQALAAPETRQGRRNQGGAAPNEEFQTSLLAPRHPSE